LTFEITDSERDEPWKMSFRESSGRDAHSDQLEAVGIGTTSLTWSVTPPFGGDLFYVQADRIGPQKLYPRSKATARQNLLGARGEFALNYLSENSRLLPNGDPRLSNVQGEGTLDVVNHWLGDLSPGARLDFGDVIVQADMLVAGFSFEREGDIATRSFRPTNVGFGLSYVLPVLAALLVSPGSLLLIENPEAHLHPQGQTRLAGLFVQAALAGVQVFVESHSDHFLDGIRLAVREERLRPDQVAIHYFRRQGTSTSVSSPKLNEDGRLSRWPEGFFDQHEDNLARLLAPRR